MNHETYHKLEDRFVYLSESKKFEYEQAEWTMLESRLDQDDLRKRYFFILLFFGVVSVAIISALFILPNSISNSEETRISAEPIAKTATTSGVVSDALADQDEDAATISNMTNESVDGGGNNLTSVSGVQAGSLPTEGGITTTPTPAAAYTATNALTQSESQSSSKSPLEARGIDNITYKKNLSAQVGEGSNENDLGQGHISNFEKNTGSNDLNPTVGNTGGVIDQGDVQKGLIVPVTSERTTYTLSGIPITILPLALDAKAYSLDRVRLDSSFVADVKRPKFYVNLNAGIEIASTPLGELSDTDFNFGLKLGYVASSKLVLTAGVNYINECYAADGDDYTAPTGFWASTEGVAPESIVAVCDMIDFSIGASYHFTDVQSNGLAAHVNLGSNFMVREQYDYVFSESDDNWTGIFEGESSSFLSNIELSTTYKVDLGGDLLIDAGPYLKIPTNGIGHGDVRLSSFGFRVGVSIIK